MNGVQNGLVNHIRLKICQEKSNNHSFSLPPSPHPPKKTTKNTNEFVCGSFFGPHSWRLPEELDYEIEASHQRRFAETVEATAKDGDVGRTFGG